MIHPPAGFGPAVSGCRRSLLERPGGRSARDRPETYLGLFALRPRPNKHELIAEDPHRRAHGQPEGLRAAPADESPFDTLRRATTIFSSEYMRNRKQILAQQALIVSSATLQAREAEIDRDWELAMVTLFSEKWRGDGGFEVRARVLAGASIGVIRATMRHWYASDGHEDLTAMGLDALDCLERGFGRAPNG